MSKFSRVKLITKAATPVQVSWYEVYKPLRPHTLNQKGIS